LWNIIHIQTTRGKAELYSTRGCIYLGIDISSSKLSKKKMVQMEGKKKYGQV
jgi:hypothetical protein